MTCNKSSHPDLNWTPVMKVFLHPITLALFILSFFLKKQVLLCQGVFENICFHQAAPHPFFPPICHLRQTRYFSFFNDYPLCFFFICVTFNWRFQFSVAVRGETCIILQVNGHIQNYSVYELAVFSKCHPISSILLQISVSAHFFLEEQVKFLCSPT